MRSRPPESGRAKVSSSINRLKDSNADGSTNDGWPITGRGEHRPPLGLIFATVAPDSR
jgi:hypothetical protein